MQLPEELKNVPLVVKMRDLFNMDEIPTLQAFSLTFHCDFLNLGVLTGKPILAALEASVTLWGRGLCHYYLFSAGVFVLHGCSRYCTVFQDSFSKTS